LNKGEHINSAIISPRADFSWRKYFDVTPALLTMAAFVRPCQAERCWPGARMRRLQRAVVRVTAAAAAAATTAAHRSVTATVSALPASAMASPDFLRGGGCKASRI